MLIGSAAAAPPTSSAPAAASTRSIERELDILVCMGDLLVQNTSTHLAPFVPWHGGDALRAAAGWARDALGRRKVGRDAGVSSGAHGNAGAVVRCPNLPGRQQGGRGKRPCWPGNHPLAHPPRPATPGAATPRACALRLL